PGASWTLPPAAGGQATGRVLYVFEGATATVAGTEVPVDTGVVLDAAAAAEVVAGATEVEALLLQGRPIGEPVAHYGPFVMNTPEEIRRAILDYRATRFGGWPWEDDAP